MKAILIGATGATGKVLLQQLLADETYSQVNIFVRKPTALSHPKLQEFVIDFDQPEQWRDPVQGDVLFSCLGTTIKAAGSQDAQWKIDYDYQYQFAQAARANGVPRYVLVSSFGANAKSKSFYTRMKGQLDEAVQQIGFPHCVIVRPPILERPNSDRAGEKISLAIIKGLNIIGLLKKLTPMPVATLANVMRQAAKFEGDFAIWESGEMWGKIA
ncbi:NAD(P)H-binding protein [Aggregatibacter actinomycetemcomitans]|nr:NAD(P)H-binding protein [Aggregatibacter actinomycetemcomitans]